MSPATRGRDAPKPAPASNDNKEAPSTEPAPENDSSSAAPTYAEKAATGRDESAPDGPNAPTASETTTSNDKTDGQQPPPPPTATTTTNPNPSDSEPMIDPELASLPAPPHPRPSPPADSAPKTNGDAQSNGGPPGPGEHMSITESIASAPDPRPADFNMTPADPAEIDLDALDAATAEGGPPGSPAQKLMKAIAPADATQVDTKWPSPPPNASVNLFIGRALLSHGNDNWPLKPNDIVNWIRKHYPAEWDGDEGRCSAHRVRTYLARKGADMYYEKLNQGSITGWRIRQNHLWRFENGGFMGRGMKQEEAIAAANKESEAIATAAHKAAAAEALAAGHPGVKVSMSAPGVHDGAPPPKRARKSNGQARRKNTPRAKGEMESGGEASGMQAGTADSSFYQNSPSHDQFSASQYVEASSSAGPAAVGQSSDSQPQPGNDQQPTAETGGDTSQENSSGLPIDPTLMSASQGQGDAEMDMDMVQQAMQAAVAANPGQMDEFDVQLPIEMRMHGGDQDETGGEGNYQGYQGVHHPYTPHGQDQWGQGQVYGSTGYNQGQ